MSAKLAVIPADEMTDFSRLPEAARAEVRQRLRIMSALMALERGRQAAIAVHAASIDLSPKTLRKIYDDYRKSCDWRVLVNRSKFPVSTGSQFDPRLLTFWKKLCEKNNRKTKPAHREFLRAWQRGEPVGVPWPDIDPKTGKPQGCTYRNMLRYGPTRFERRAMRQGLGAAMAEYGPKIRTTRVGLWVGSHFMIDDLLRDVELLLLGHGGQIVRPQELGVLDLFSGDRFAVHRRPQYLREDGVKDSIKEKEMRFLLASVMRNVGYSQRGTEIPAEKGTAAIRKVLAKWLGDHTGGKVTVREPGMIGKEQAIAGYWGTGGGNPNHKPHLESHHSLAHNEAANLPCPTGHDRNPPEWLRGMQAITGEVIKWMQDMPPERAALLRTPHLEYWQGLALLAEIDQRIAWATDHELEGWIECGHTTVEYRRDILRDEWLSPQDFLLLPEGDQRQLAAAASAYPAFRRARKLARREVFSRGASELVRMPDHVIALMFCDNGLGEDLRKKKRLMANGEFEIQDSAVEPEPMAFRREITRADGGLEWLSERTDYGVVLNPFDRTALWVYGPKGEFLGTAPRVVNASRVIEGSIERALGARNHEKAALLAPLAERHADAAQLIKEVCDHNAAVRGGKAVTEAAMAATRESARRNEKAARFGAALNEATPQARTTEAPTVEETWDDTNLPTQPTTPEETW